MIIPEIKAQADIAKINTFTLNEALVRDIPEAPQ